MTEPRRPEFPVEVFPMPQLAEARDPDDDWTGLKDRAARRKRQWRLNARAYRKRKQQQPEQARYDTRPENWQGHMYLDQTGPRPCHHSMPVSARQGHSTTCLMLGTPSFRHISLDGTVRLPLSSDHLIPLIQFNAFRATLTNMLILSVVHLLPNECDVSLALEKTPLFPFPAVPPPCLAPTPLQQSIPHDMWIDLLPHSTMRDNAIRAMGTYDHRDLTNDMMGGYERGQNTIETTGVLIWGNPWEAEGWEVTEGFMKKWAFLFKDCWDVMAATNRWRAERGDEPLVFEIQE